MWNLSAHFLYLFRWLFIIKRTFPRLTWEQTTAPPLIYGGADNCSSTYSVHAESKSFLILLLKKKKSHDKIRELTCNGLTCPRIFKTCSLHKSKYCPGKTAPEGDSGIHLWNRDKRNRGNLSSQAGGRNRKPLWWGGLPFASWKFRTILHSRYKNMYEMLNWMAKHVQNKSFIKHGDQSNATRSVCFEEGECQPACPGTQHEAFTGRCVLPDHKKVWSTCWNAQVWENPRIKVTCMS